MHSALHTQPNVFLALWIRETKNEEPTKKKIYKMNENNNRETKFMRVRFDISIAWQNVYLNFSWEQMCARTHSVCSSDGAVATSTNNFTATKYQRRRIENSRILLSMQFHWEMSWQKPSKWFWMIPYVLFMPLKCTPQTFCGMSIFSL